MNNITTSQAIVSGCPASSNRNVVDQSRTFYDDSDEQWKAFLDETPFDHRKALNKQLREAAADGAVDPKTGQPCQTVDQTINSFIEQVNAFVPRGHDATLANQLKKLKPEHKAGLDECIKIMHNIMDKYGILLKARQGRWSIL